MTRDQALNKLKEDPIPESEIKIELDFVARKLGVTIEDLNKFMKLPLKTYRDYKNEYWLYNFGSKILKKMGIEIGGKR